MNKKRTSAIGAGVAATALVVGGVAYAAFSLNQSADVAGTSAEKFDSVEVSGVWLGRNVNGGYPAGNKKLLPGEGGDVRLTLKLPNTNTVQGKVTDITPVAPAQASASGCDAQFEIAKYTPTGPNAVVIANNGVSVTVTLKDAVKLKGTATQECSDATYPTKFRVNFDATRDTPGAPTTPLQPDGNNS